MHSASSVLPPWADELVTLYESDAASQFIIHGNVEDRVLIPAAAGDSGATLGNLEEFLAEVLLPTFDVVLSYDLGNGIRVVKGREIFYAWPFLKEGGTLPRKPHPAIETLTRYFRYVANLQHLGGEIIQVACWIRGAHLVAPQLRGGTHFESDAAGMLLRTWATDLMLTGHPLATFLITENLADLHPLVVGCPRAARIEVPLPDVPALGAALEVLADEHPRAFSDVDDLGSVAGELAGASLGSVEILVRIKHHEREPLERDDVVALKKDLVEADCGGLIDFVQSEVDLDDYLGPEALKRRLRQDLALWRRGDILALPKGYLLCGPVGTGKTFLAECLAGEAGVPVVVLANFRDKWVGSTESNLETIFRLLHALGRCFVFIDEADQTLGKRDAGSGDSGLSGRVYSMIAQQMSARRNRGRIIWILASSRPDLIEIDLKRPGRVDAKIPLFPAATPEQGFALIRALAGRYGLGIPEDALDELSDTLPELITPAAAETLAVQTYRLAATEDLDPVEALERQLATYRNPVPRDVLEAQMRLAAREASDHELIPEAFRYLVDD
ncbi:MAG: AAA family ATPase [Acidobacteriota bacterium]